MIYAPITEPVRLNFPPLSELPPIATARIASISMSSSSVSWLMSPIRLTPIAPDMAQQTPSIMKESIFIPTALMPFRRADFSLMPTACVYSPRFVSRSTSEARIPTARTIKTGEGMGHPGIKLPI